MLVFQHPVGPMGEGSLAGMKWAFFFVVPQFIPAVDLPRRIQ
jgi:hypothetical protein